MADNCRSATGEAAGLRDMGLARATRPWWRLRREPPLRERAISLEQKLKAGLKIDPGTGCHLWTGSMKKGIYGSVNVSTHRLAWELARRPIPEGLFVLHRCDNRACCNPKHLYLGTQADNMADMARKGRGRKPTGRPPAPRKRAKRARRAT